MKNHIEAVARAAALLLAVAAGSLAVAGEPAAPVVVLDTTGFWRTHHTLKPPVIQLDNGLQVMDLRWVRGERILGTFDWARRETPPPADGWAQADFEDTSWLRGPARMTCRTAFLSKLCMRGKFMVDDPAGVRDLQLSVGYRGGVIVYMNGREVARRHLPKGARDKDLLADGYPAEAFTPTGGWNGRNPRHPQLEADEEIALRRRSARIAIPSDYLRKGVNVLGLEVVRAPYHKVLEEMKGKRGTRHCLYYPAFNTCQIDLVRLTAAPGSALTSNAVRPKGFQVWNNSVLGADFDLDFGDPGPLNPIRLVGARNGIFSGKVVVGSTEPIRGLRATASDLTCNGGTIPSSAVRLRYGIPWGHEAGVNGQRTIYHPSAPEFNCYARVPTMLGALAEQPPAEAPVRGVETSRSDLVTPGQPEPVPGAVVPVWVTVNVPKDAPAGLFTGQVTIRAEGQDPVQVPVELKVADYTLPDPDNYRTMLELIQAPDTLVFEYGVKPWSDEHFALIARSMRLMHETGVQVVYVPLIAETNLGNEESMVRWIDRGNKNYDFDFSIMERYLDLAVKEMGRPRVLCFVVWDIYLRAGGGYKDTWGHNQASVEARAKYADKGPMVTLLDPGTGKTETIHAPRFSDPGSKTVWSKLLAEIRARMARRGLEDVMMMGFLSDDWPTRAEDAFYREVTGGLNWVSHSHIPVTRGNSKMENGIVTTAATSQGNAKVDRVGFRVEYHSAVLSCEFADSDPRLGSLLGWKRPDLGCYQPRYESRQPASRWRELMEFNITGAQRGVARGGADLWAAVRDSRGRRAGNVTDRYPHSAWRNLDIPWCMFAPGPTGPVSTHQYEALREGVQECQARILLEGVMTTERLKRRLGPELAGRCENLLVERTHFMLKAITHQQINNQWGHVTGPSPVCRQISVNGHRWFVGSGWQERSEELYALAGEVARKLGIDTASVPR